MSFVSLLESLNSTSCLTLQQKINSFIHSHLPCRTVFCIYISHYANEGLIQVVGDSILEEEFWFSIPEEFDLKSPKLTERKNEPLDNEINSKLRFVLDPYPRTILKVPIRHPDKAGCICFLVCLVDPIYNGEVDEYSYSLFVKECLGYCSAILLNAFHAVEERRMKDLYQKLLLMSKFCLAHTGDYNEILKNILVEARLLLNAERCSLFLLSEDRTELVAKIFDGAKADRIKDIRVPVNRGVVGHVATNGDTLNVRDAQTHPLFNRHVDEVTGFKTRNILCFPVQNELQQVVGVVQMINKEKGHEFLFVDEEAAAALSVHFSLALMHNILHRRIRIVKARDSVSSELFNYHLAKYQEDYRKILYCKTKHNYQDMLDYRWISREVSRTDAVCYVLRMFDHLGLMKTWKISRKTLVCFVLSVEKCYRDLPYHNWTHGFSVAHFAYYLMHHLRLLEQSMITDLEGLAFLVSALCHDVDHRGTTNSFQFKSRNSLACLYGSDGSVMESHHFSQTLTILNIDNCNIFENLTVSQYVRVLSLIRDMIIASDVSQHFRVLPAEREMSLTGYNPAKKAHRSLLLSLMMTCCDLNDQVKGWHYCRDIAELIYEEFFLQGDMEKEMGLVPVEMMDREKAFIPRLQLEFLQQIAIPTFTVLSNIFPSLSVFGTALGDVAKCWERGVEWFRTNRLPENRSIDFIFCSSLEEYVLRN